MVTPAIRALRRHFQESVIDVLTGEWSAPILHNNPHINRVIAVPDDIFFNRKWRELIRLIRQLRIFQYDLALLFQPALPIRVLVKLSGVTRIAGLTPGCHSAFLDTPVRWRPRRDRYVVEDFLDVVRSLGIADDGTEMEIHTDSSSEQHISGLMQQNGIQRKTYCLLCPAGGRNPRDIVRQKIWSPQKYAALAHRLLSDGIPVVVSAHESELPDIRDVLRVDGIIDVTGKVSIPELCVLVENARFLVTNDSLPMHIALAVRCPVVPIFGPSRARALLPPQGMFISLEASAACAPCYDNEPFPHCHRFDCIDSISLESVWKAVTDVVERWSNDGK